MSQPVHARARVLVCVGFWLMGARSAGGSRKTDGDALFYGKLYRFHSEAFSNTKHHKWLGTSGHGEWLTSDELRVLFSHEENYAPLLNHFFDGVDGRTLPQQEGIPWNALNRMLTVGDGLNPPFPLRSPEEKRFGHALDRWFTEQAPRLVTEADLYIPNTLHLPFVRERNTDGHVLVAVYYRHGIVLDRLMSRIPPLHWLPGRSRRFLELGAGWGGFPSLVKKVDSRGGFAGRVQYTILDLPHSCLIQANFLKSLGWKKLVLYDSSMGDLNAILRAGDYDVLWILPQHLPLVEPDSFDVVVNFDSLVEMPSSVISNYLPQIAKVARGFYSVNIDYNQWDTLQAEIRKLEIEAGFVRHGDDSKQPIVRDFGGSKLPFSVGLFGETMNFGGKGYFEQLRLKSSKAHHLVRGTNASMVLHHDRGTSASKAHHAAH